MIHIISICQGDRFIMYNFSKSKKILFAIMAVSSLTFAACSQKNSSDENVTSNQAQTEYESKSSGTQARDNKRAD